MKNEMEYKLTEVDGQSMVNRPKSTKDEKIRYLRGEIPVRREQFLILNSKSVEGKKIKLFFLIILCL
jgi:hypothetical protein